MILLLSFYELEATILLSFHEPSTIYIPGRAPAA
jgi:hypothetical protein